MSLEPAGYYWFARQGEGFSIVIRAGPAEGLVLFLSGTSFELRQHSLPYPHPHTTTKSDIMGITTELPKTVTWNGKQVPVYPMQTVDFSQLLSQEPSEIEKLVKCCQTEGFFYIDLQGIDGRRMLDDQQETLKLMHRFFESPLEVKNEYGLVSPHLGYEPVGSRTGVLENTKDGYEMIKVRPFPNNPESSSY